MATRQEQRELSKTKILTAAKEIFLREGYHASTTKQIAKLAGVGEGTIFNHFKSKSDLLIAIYEEMMLANRAEYQFQFDPAKNAYDCIDDYFDFFLAQTKGISKEWLREIFSAAYRSAENEESLYSGLMKIDDVWTTSFLDFLKILQDKNLIRRNVDLERVVKIMSAILVQHYSAYSVLENQSFNVFKQDVQKDIHFLVEHILSIQP